MKFKFAAYNHNYTKFEYCVHILKKLKANIDSPVVTRCKSKNLGQLMKDRFVAISWEEIHTEL